MPSVTPHFSKCEVCVGGCLHIYFLSKGVPFPPPSPPPPPLPKISPQEQPFYIVYVPRALTEWE